MEKTWRALSLSLALAATAFPLWAPRAAGQARAGCPVRPQSVATMRGCYRPVLVFSPSSADPRLKQQEAWLDGAADDMMDRNILFVPVLGRAQGYQAPLDAPAAAMSPRENAALRRRFGVAPGNFRVVLLGEDGGAKLTSSAPIASGRFNSVIDRMPARRREMQQPHSN